MTQSVLIDGHNLTLPHASGIGTYARNLASAVGAIGFQAEVLVGGNSAVHRKDRELSEIELFDRLTQVKPSRNLRFQRLVAQLIGKPLGVSAYELSRIGIVFDYALEHSNKVLGVFDKLYVATSLSEFGLSHFKRYGARLDVKLESAPSLFHVTYPAPYQTRGCPNIYTIHDLVPLRLPQTTLDEKRVALNLTRLLCQKADHIVTVSEYSKADIMRFFNIPENRISNTYQSVEIPTAIINKSEDDVATEVSRNFQVDYRGYYLFFGAIEPKKNLIRIIDGYAASGSPFPLLVVGALGWEYDREVERLKDERFLYYRREGDQIFPSRKVRRISYLPFSQLMTLVKGARGVLFPSLYEGFGLPVLEAMTLGTPVITSNVAALPEISAGAATLVDPTDVDAIARAIRDFDHDDGLRQELATLGKKRAAFFAPEMYRDRIANLYASLGVRPDPVAGEASRLERSAAPQSASRVADAV